MDYKALTKPWFDNRVDDLERADGGIDQLASLEVNIPDNNIIKNLNNRIEDSLDYWQDTKGYNLRESRNEAVRLHLGKQIDTSRLYRYQVPYVENEVFVAIESMVAYLTSQPPQPESYPAQGTPESKILATDLEKALQGHSDKFDLRLKLEECVRQLLLKRVGFLYVWFDPDYGEHGDIRVEALDPEYVIVDKNARRGENPEFICIVRKSSVEELCYRFPEKAKQIYEAMGYSRGTAKQRSEIVAWRQVFLTTYSNGKPEEVCVAYFNNVVLAKYKDPNWIYNKNNGRINNFLDMPMKPVIPMNYINDGSHWVDQTSPVEQASSIQHILNKRGRQIMENADTANGILVFDGEALTKDDAENLTGDPNQKILLDNKGGRPLNQLVYQIPPHILPDYVVEDKQDLRNTIHAIMGTPAQFRGNEDNQSDTLGQDLQIKQQAAGRQDLIVRSIDACAKTYFNFLTQMMKVHYTKDHYFTINGGDGQFDHIAMNRNLIEDGISISVKAGTSLPFDKNREEAITVNLAKQGLLAPYDVYKGLHMDNPQKLYDNWYKYKTDPVSLAREVNDIADDQTAYIDYKIIMDGQEAKPRDDAAKEHILTHRKQMLTDDFLKADGKIQREFLKHVAAEVKSLELRTTLDQMSQVGEQNLEPQVPLWPVPPPTPPPMPGMMGQVPSVVPGGQGLLPPPGLPQMQGQQPPGAAPGALPPQPPMPQPSGQTVSSVFAGTGLPNPATPQVPPAAPNLTV